MIEFVDEVLDPSLQPDINPRYTIKDNNGKVLNDNVQIELKTPIITRGTPINKALFEDIIGMNNYQLMTLASQDYVGIPTIAPIVYGQLDSVQSGVTKWAGHIDGKNDANKWDFYMENSNGATFSLGTVNYTGRVSIYALSGSNNKLYTLEAFNNILSRTEFSNEYNITLDAESGVETYFVWDMKKACKPIFNYNVNASGYNSTYYPNIYLRASNDGSSWMNYGSLDLGGYSIRTKTIASSYRYYQLRIAFHGDFSSPVRDSYAMIYNAFFTNVDDELPRYRNNFVLDNNDFSVQQQQNVITPSFSNPNLIVENALNGIPIDIALKENSAYSLRYNGEKLINIGAKNITGSFTPSSSLQIIDLGFEPDLVICYSHRNNYGVIAAHNSNSTSLAYHTPRVLTKALKHEYGQILPNGFSFRSISPTMDTIYYIAIRF